MLNRARSLRTALTIVSPFLLCATSSASVTFAGDYSHDGATTVVGITSQGSLLIDAGSALNTTDTAQIGYWWDAFGNVTVTDPGSNWTATTHIVGYLGDATLEIRNGATVNSTDSWVGDVGEGEVNIDGTGSRWYVDQTLVIGDAGKATVEVTNGAKLVVGRAAAIGGFNRSGSVLVSGSGSAWQSAQEIFAGLHGEAYLVMEDHAFVRTQIFASGQPNSPTEIRLLSGANFYVDNVAYIGTGSTTTFEIDGGNAYLKRLVAGDNQVNADHAAIRLFDGMLDLRGGTFEFRVGSASFEFTGGIFTNVSSYQRSLVQNGGTFRIFDAVGVSHVEGDYELHAGSIEFQLFNDDGLPGESFDQLIVDGELALTGTVKIINAGMELTAGDSVDIVDFQSITDLGYIFDFSLAPLESGLLWDTSDFEIDGTIRVAPEPSTWLTLCAAVSTVLSLRRSKGSSAHLE